MATQSGDFLTTGKQDPKLNLAQCIAKVKREHGRSLFSQIGDIVNLVYRGHRLSLEEYYYYRLYDNESLTREEKGRFLGKKAQDQTIPVCNPPAYWGLAHDKLIFQIILQGLGAPSPRPLAILHPHRRMQGVQSLRDAAELTAFLEAEPGMSFFAKPIKGMWSVGTVAAKGLDQNGDLVLADGTTVPLPEFGAKLESLDLGGYLVQELITPHSSLAETCGPGLSTLRMIVMLWDEGPELYQVVGKLIGGGNSADNFWRKGNLLAGLDRDNGTIVRSVQGVGPYQQELSHHPDTGKELTGFQWPHYQEAKDLVMDMSRQVPQIKLQAWDIAVNEKGPCVIELNIGGDFNLPQTAAAKGLMCGRFQQFLEHCRARNAS